MRYELRAHAGTRRGTLAPTGCRTGEERFDMADTRRGEMVSRRTALAGLSAGGIGLAMTATTGRSVAAQDASSTALVGHAMVGSWQMLAGDALGAPSGDPTVAT